MITATAEQIPAIVEEAARAARIESTRYFTETLNGQDRYACGFAWVNIYGVKGSTKIGRALAAQGIRRDYSGGLQMWMPGRHPAQNIDVHEAGATAAALVFRKYGFEAYAGSRMD